MPKSKNDKLYEAIGFLIKKRREELGITQQKLGELISMETISIQRYESGYSKIAIDYLIKIAKILKVDFFYFFPNKKNSNIPTVPCLPEYPEPFDKLKYKLLPVYAYAGAGKFIDLTEIEPIDTILIPKEYANNGSLAVVKVVGKSMEPMIHEGAYIGVDKDDRSFVSGNIYAVYLPFEGTVIKKVFTDIKNVILKSENKEFPDIVIPLKNIDKDNFIIGRVKWVLQKF